MFAINQDIEKHIVDAKITRKVLGTGGSLMLVEVHFNEGGIGLPHSHAEHEQVSYIVKGSFRATVGEEERVLYQGDSFYAGKNVEHGLVALEDSIILDVFTPIRQDFIK